MCFSEFTSTLPKTARDQILAQYHQPYQQQVLQKIESMLQSQEKVVHISVHSFCPQLYGEIRNADIGFLYNPKHAIEKSLCLRWKKALTKVVPELRVRFNYPYLGITDGLCTLLRKRFAPDNYAGIELEMNQALTADPLNNQRLQNLISETLKTCLEQLI